MVSQIINSTPYIIYSYFMHNYIFIAYVIGLIISVVLSFYTPSRNLLFYILGFAILSFAFQYDKHFAIQVSNELLGTINSQGNSVTFSNFTVITSEILPIVFYSLGWGFIFAGLISQTLLNIKKKDPISKNIYKKN